MTSALVFGTTIGWSEAMPTVAFGFVAMGAISSATGLAITPLDVPHIVVRLLSSRARGGHWSGTGH